MQQFEPPLFAVKRIDLIAFERGVRIGCDQVVIVAGVGGCHLPSQRSRTAIRIAVCRGKLLLDKSMPEAITFSIATHGACGHGNDWNVFAGRFFQFSNGAGGFGSVPFLASGNPVKIRRKSWLIALTTSSPADGASMPIFSTGELPVLA